MAKTIQTYTVTEDAGNGRGDPPSAVSFSTWNVNIADTNNQAVSVTDNSFIINYPTIMVKRTNNVGIKKYAAANFRSTLKNSFNSTLWTLIHRKPSDSEQYTWSSEFTQNTDCQVYRRTDQNAYITLNTETYFNADNKNVRTINFSWTTQLQAGSSSNQKTAGLHSRAYESGSYESRMWTTNAKTTTWNVPVTLNAPPNVVATTSLHTPKSSNTTGYAGLSTLIVDFSATTFKYGGTVSGTTVAELLIGNNVVSTLSNSSFIKSGPVIRYMPASAISGAVTLKVYDSRGQVGQKSLGTYSFSTPLNPKNISISGDLISNTNDGGFWRRCSTATASISGASQIVGATIKTASMSVGGATAGTRSGNGSVTTGILQTAGTYSPTVTITDSYDKVASLTISTKAIVVKNPTVSAIINSVDRIGADNKPADGGTMAVIAVRFNRSIIQTGNTVHSFLYTPIVTLNSGMANATWYTGYDKSSGNFSGMISDWTNYNPIDGVVLYGKITRTDGGFDPDTTYRIYVQPRLYFVPPFGSTEIINGSTANGAVRPLFYLLSGRAGGKGLGIGMKAPDDNLYINMQTKLADAQNTIRPLFDFFYPVGSYYETSDADFRPNETWGGTWILETEGQVHVSGGSSETYTVDGALTNETDGGSKDTIIPYHTHSNTIKAKTPKFVHSVSVGQPKFTIPAHTHPTGTTTDKDRFLIFSVGISNEQGGAISGTGYYYPRISSNDWGYCTATGSSGGGTYSPSTNGTVTISDHSATDCTMSGGVSYTGETVTNANMMPYIVVYRWHRIA